MRVCLIANFSKLIYNKLIKKSILLNLMLLKCLLVLFFKQFKQLPINSDSICWIGV